MPRSTTKDSDADILLFDVLHALREELAELRDAINELREEIQWGNRNRQDYNPALFSFHPEKLTPKETASAAQALAPSPACQRAATDEREENKSRQQRGLF